MLELVNYFLKKFSAQRLRVALPVGSNWACLIILKMSIQCSF